MYLSSLVIAFARVEVRVGYRNSKVGLKLGVWVGFELIQPIAGVGQGK